MNAYWKKLHCLALVLLVAGMSGCSSRDSLLANEDEQPAAANEDDAAKAKAETLLAEGRGHFAKRGERASLDAAIAAWEEAARLDPARADIQLEMTYAYYFLAHGHLRFDDDEDGMKDAYDKGVDAAERAIYLLSPEFKDKIKGGEDWEDAVTIIGKDAQPAIYWYATNLGKWALLDGFTTILANKDRAAAIMDHARQLDETFLHGAPHRYFGVYRTKIPFPGGDMPASKTHFERAIEIQPSYLETKVLFAENYAVKNQDEELFDRLIEEVLAAPDDVMPDLVPENEVAKRTAKKLKDEKDEYF